ncbi:hypothetical protein F4604DRAFT_1031970 [Suillus subluteus]|nr:hypothetical protein F4604DRAFT_1031970 [Suillus subluteus]
MPSQPESPQTVFIPIKLGKAARYDPSIFPFMRVKNNSAIGLVDLALECTLDEIFKIREMVTDKKNFQDLVADAKFSYDNLRLQRDKLADRRKSINPLKQLSAYRSSRLLVEAGVTLYQDTKSTSERVRREIISHNSTDVERVQPDDNDLASDTGVDGIAFECPLDESMAALVTDAASFIASHVDLLSEGNPFADDHEVEDARANVGTECSSTADSATDADGSSGSRLSGASSPSTSSSGQGSGNTFLFFKNSYVASRSVIHTPTLNQGGSHNRGSSTRR